MTEEFVTQSIIRHLAKHGYTIVSFDFPQSGTGILLHPDASRDKNEGIKPDIVASRDELLVVMENKNRYCKKDFEKLHCLKTSTHYALDLKKLHNICKTTTLNVGVGIPDAPRVIQRALSTRCLIDFIIGVDEDGNCNVIWGNI